MEGIILENIKRKMPTLNDRCVAEERFMHELLKINKYNNAELFCNNLI